MAGVWTQTLSCLPVLLRYPDNASRRWNCCASFSVTLRMRLTRQALIAVFTTTRLAKIHGIPPLCGLLPDFHRLGTILNRTTRWVCTLLPVVFPCSCLRLPPEIKIAGVPRSQAEIFPTARSWTNLRPCHYFLVQLWIRR